MKVFDEPLEFLTYEQLVDKYYDHGILLFDPAYDENGHIDGGYVKAVEEYDCHRLFAIQDQYPDRKTTMLVISDLVYRAMGVYPFNGGGSSDPWGDDNGEV